MAWYNTQPTAIPIRKNYSYGYGGSMGRENDDGWGDNTIPAKLLRMLMGGMNRDQKTMDAWLKNMIGTATGQLGGQLGSQFARTNVAVPSGAQAIANRYMAPLGSLIEGNKPMNWTDKLTQAMSLGKGLTSAMQPLDQKKGDGIGKNRGYQDYMEQLFGKNNRWDNMMGGQQNNGLDNIMGRQKKWGRW